MYAVIWRYEVKPEVIPTFRSLYGPEGQWASLFGRAQGYLGTELYRDDATPDHFLTIDRWVSRDAFAVFMSIHGQAYAAMDTKCDGLTVSELRLGDLEGEVVLATTPLRDRIA